MQKRLVVKTINNKQKAKEIIVIGVNSLVSTTHNAYSNHIRLFYRLGRAYPQYDFVFVNPPRMAIDRMRNMAAEVAIQANAKYLIFLDDDVLVPHDFLTNFEALVAAGNGICCGNVQIRGYPFDYMMFQWDRKKTGLITLKKLPTDNSVVQLDAIGFSLALITVDLLRKVSKPYFITTHNMTEDVSFCLKVRDEFPETKMACDPKVVCGHILWNEVISDFNRKNYTKYYEQQYPLETAGQRNKDKKPNGDRGNEYLAMVKQTTIKTKKRRS